MNTITSSITPFNFEDKQVRILTIDGEPWFVAADVCAVLSIANPRDATSRLDDDEKGVAQTDTLGGKQSISIISESGLYSLVLRSDKPQARPFRKWVTSEVLPAIRKTGRYEHPATQAPVVPQPEPKPEPELRYVTQQVVRGIHTHHIELCYSAPLQKRTGRSSPLIESITVARLAGRAHFPLLKQLRTNKAMSAFKNVHFEWWWRTNCFQQDLPSFLMTRDGFTMLTRPWRESREDREMDMERLFDFKNLVYQAFDQEEDARRKELEKQVCPDAETCVTLRIERIYAENERQKETQYVH